MPWRPPVLESSIQRTVVEYARTKGAVAIKLSVQGAMGVAGYPDYLFMKPREDGKIGFKVLFIEFKQPSGGLSPRQRERIKILKAKKYQVEVVASPEYGKLEIDRWLLKP